MVNETKQFGDGYERDTDRPNLFLFPRDVEWRRSLGYPPEVMQHPAKMQLHIVKAVLEYYGQPGDKVLDPFGGTGTTALAAVMGYDTTLFELEPVYQDLLTKAQQGLKLTAPLHLKFGDATQLIKAEPDNYYNIVISSPPYANLQVGKVGKDTVVTGRVAELRTQFSQYGSAGAHPLNFGRLNQFVFAQNMNRIYQGLARVLAPGGIYVSVTKDSMRAGVRQMMSMDLVRDVQLAGLKYSGDWFKWKPPGSMFQEVQKTKGMAVIDDEDIIVFRKED